MVTCKTCGVKVATGDQSDEIKTNRLLSHLFLVHTLPYIEDMLKEHAGR